MADMTLPPAYRALESLCGGGDGVDVDRIRDPDADAYAEQKLGLTSAMRKSTNGSNPSGIASNPPDAAHSFNPQQVKDDPTSQQWVLPEGPDRYLQLGRCAQPTKWEKGRTDRRTKAFVSKEVKKTCLRQHPE